MEGEGWVDAEDLQVGDDIRNADGETGEVESIEFEQTSQEMYNLTVDEAHTFFVGDGQWLVHNAGACTLYNPLTDSDALMDFANRAKTYHEGKRRISLHDDWQRIAREGLGEGEELYIFTRDGRINGAIQIQLEYSGPIPGTNNSGLYFNLFEIAGNDPDALPELLRTVIRRSNETGYGGWIYGVAEPQAEKFYKRLGAQFVDSVYEGDPFKYTVFDPRKGMRYSG